MKYQKIINLLNNTPSHPTKFRTKEWVEINDDKRGTYKINSQIKFKASVLKSSLCDYSDAYILLSGTITITVEGADHAGKRLDKREKGLIFKNCAPFTDSISETNNTQIVHAKNADVVMPKYNLIEYSDNYSDVYVNIIKMNQIIM